MHYLYSFEAMTTPCEVHLYTDDKIKADKTAKKILEEAKRLEKKYSYYRKESVLSQINSRHTSRLDPETKSLLQQASKFYNETEGAFDVTVATFKKLYHQNLTLQELQENRNKLLNYVGCEYYAIKRNSIIFDNPYTQIDLGGLVKEYAVDQSIKIIKRAKITSALISFGGDIFALGTKPNGTLFNVGISNPNSPSEVITHEKIHNQALTTSASYERSYTVENQTFSHIFSTKTSSDIAPKSVTVISPSCVVSGVYSTALMTNPQLIHPYKTIIY